MKIAPIIRASAGRLEYRLIHTGQHYDAMMADGLFAQLGIPEPDVNLKVGSGAQAKQTAAIMVGYEELLLQRPSKICLVVGDVNSTMACAITARKLDIPVAHVEAGIRSGDLTMPEEINRMVTDSITDYFFTTSRVANENLRRIGVDEDRIFFVGSTMIDTLLANIKRLRPPAFWNERGLETGGYFVVTLHRPTNVDACDTFARLLGALGESTRGMPVVFPVHPRTAKTLQEIDGIPDNIITVESQPYLEFIYLAKNAKAVITDSGGVTEETTVMGVPCITLRDSNERPETVSIGTNEVVGTDPSKLKPALDRLFAGAWKQGGIPELWDGHTGERIVEILGRIM